MKKVIIEKAKAFKINPKGRYLLIFDKADAGDDASLTQLNQALTNLFSPAKVLAIFAKDIDSVKVAELVEEVNENG